MLYLHAIVGTVDRGAGGCGANLRPRLRTRYPLMPLLFIKTLNSTFQSRDDGIDYDRPEDALAAGVNGALEIARDELQGGRQSAAVDVCIEQEDGKVVLHSVVAISISPLLTGAE